MHDRDAAKRIPKSLGTDAKLIGSFTLTDVAVALLPGVFVVLAMQVILPADLSVGGLRVQSLTLPLAGLGIALGGLFVALTPRYTSSATWIATFLGFLRSDHQFDHETAREFTQVDRVHPDHDAIERTDGAVLGMVQVDPPTMALATDGEWEAKAEAFQDFLNTTVAFPIQLYSTTRAFPVDEYLARYESRLDDPDVQSNPRLARLIEEYVDWYAAELESRRMTIRDHYVIVAVTPEEVAFDDRGLTTQLVRNPLIGIAVRAWRTPSAEERQDAMFTALDDRLQRIEGGLREIDGCDARRIDVAEAMQVVEEFWTGESRPIRDPDQVVRTSPIVGGAR